MDYHPNVFYNTRDWTLEQKRAALLRGKELAYEWWTDKLDCSISSSRQRIDMSFEEIMAMLDQECHFVIIHRKGYLQNRDSGWNRWHVELGFCTMAGVSYYLWINVEEQHIDGLIKELQIKPM